MHARPNFAQSKVATGQFADLGSRTQLRQKISNQRRMLNQQPCIAHPLVADVVCAGKAGVGDPTSQLRRVVRVDKLHRALELTHFISVAPALGIVQCVANLLVTPHHRAEGLLFGLVPPVHWNQNQHSMEGLRGPANEDRY